MEDFMSTYLIASMKVHNHASYEIYKEMVPEIISKHSGNYIIRGGELKVVEGSWPGDRVAVLEFPDYSSARNFIDDPEYKPIAEIRKNSSTSHIWLIDGVAKKPNTTDMHGYILGRVLINDDKLYKTYADKVPAVMTELGGAYLARGGFCETIEGDLSLDRIVIVGFLDIHTADTFHKSDLYAPLLNIRSNASESNIVIVEGL
jgi:uncharacterized protein (DUF1330 family)